MKRKIHLALIILFSILSVNAQNTSNDAIINKIKADNTKINTLQGTMTRTKKIAMVKNEIVSNGIVLIQDNNLAIFYSKPVETFKINGDKIYVAALGKTHKVDASKNSEYKELKNILINAMHGDIKAILATYNGSVEYSSDKNNHIFTLTSNDQKLSKGYKKMTLKYCKDDCSINELTLVDATDTNITYSVSNKKINQNIDKDEFIIE